MPAMNNIVSIQSLNKVYASGFTALKNISFDIREGEILALLGPNGAGKTTLISTICGIVNASSGTVTIAGYDNRKDFRKSRELVGLVPQELTLGAFDHVIDTVRYSRGLFGKPPDEAYLKSLLSDLTLLDKRNDEILALSGGMKRRVLIAKALSHQPKILFLDEPTAGVDVALRKDMWKLVERLRAKGVTVILTTHYIEEAEAIADRIGVINNGELILIEEKQSLMQKMGKQQLILYLSEPISAIPEVLHKFDLTLSEDKLSLTYNYNTSDEGECVSTLLKTLSQTTVPFMNLRSKRTSLEEIFVDLVKK